VVRGADPERARIAASFLVNNMPNLLNEANLSIEQSKMSPERMAELVNLVADGTINLNIARTILPELFASGASAADLAKQRGLGVVKDESALEKAVDDALSANPKAVADYLGGKESALAAFLGPIMKATRGQADATVVRELLRRKLEGLRASG
jgi:aspartyl-tRNA(Asn)/glutamyl-tRNA(Gln) amidotransferase subunit B